MAIIDSVRKLAEKVGADTNGRTIADQMNLINQHLEATNGRDISEAVNYYADKAGGSSPTPETFDVEVEVTFTDTAPIATVNKTYQQIKSEIDLGKTISGTIRVTYNSLVSSGELSISYVRDFYYATKVASDAIFIVTEPFLLNLTSENKMNFIIPVVITPDNKVWLTMTDDWASNPET